MRHLFVILYCVFGTYSLMYCQNTIRGTITDENNLPLFGCQIYINNYSSSSDISGNYIFKDILDKKLDITISKTGYQSIKKTISYEGESVFNFILKPKIDLLDEIVIKSTNQQINNINKEIVNQKYIQDNFEGSLAKSLGKLPGINAMEVGAGASKPIIRGLGFNRISVTENGIKQEGQQWGADHGLEIDALTVERLEILKGVGSIEYGSDAIGGVINIKNDIIPAKNTFSGKWTTIGKSVNQGLTSSVSLQYRKNFFFYKLKNTISEYGDYNLPTDHITYLTQNIPIYNKRLKNTAGNELDWFGQIGYVSEKFKSVLSISNVSQKSGFFPGSHGIPNLDRIKDDGKRRNIEFPFQNVNHLKVTYKNEWFFNDSDLTFILGYQNNLRQEWSEFHTHYTGQTPPLSNPNLEMEFDLSTYDIQLKYKQIFSEKHQTVIGIQTQWQKNKISGYSFLLPEYKRGDYGVFTTHNYKFSDKTTYNLGIRFDLSQMNINRYFDPILYDYLIGNNESIATANDYAERSPNITQHYNNFNIMAGTIHEINNNWGLSFNAGTGFRLPTAIELAANGIHHGSFRHEQGNKNLNPEKGILLDTKLNYNKNEFTMGFSPYVYYFENYIYLSPSGKFSILPDAGQIYKYEQTRAFLSGVEFNIQNTFFNKLRTEMVLEYLYNRQLNRDNTKNFPLPFTPPVNGFFEVGYTFFGRNKTIQNTLFYINSKLTLKQDRIAQNEEITPGSVILGTGIKSTVAFGNFKADLHLQVSNLFDTKYYNHTSFYRAIELPEMGRNIRLMIRIPFNKTPYEEK